MIIKRSKKKKSLLRMKKEKKERRRKRRFLKSLHFQHLISNLSHGLIICV